MNNFSVDNIEFDFDDNYGEDEEEFVEPDYDDVD